MAWLPRKLPPLDLLSTEGCEKFVEVIISPSESEIERNIERAEQQSSARSSIGTTQGKTDKKTSKQQRGSKGSSKKGQIRRRSKRSDSESTDYSLTASAYGSSLGIPSIHESQENLEKAFEKLINLSIDKLSERSTSFAAPISISKTETNDQELLDETKVHSVTSIENTQSDEEKSKSELNLELPVSSPPKEPDIKSKTSKRAKKHFFEHVPNEADLAQQILQTMFNREIVKQKLHNDTFDANVSVKSDNVQSVVDKLSTTLQADVPIQSENVQSVGSSLSSTIKADVSVKSDNDKSVVSNLSTKIKANVSVKSDNDKSVVSNISTKIKADVSVKSDNDKSVVSNLSTKIKADVSVKGDNDQSVVSNLSTTIKTDVSGKSDHDQPDDQIHEKLLEFSQVFTNSRRRSLDSWRQQAKSEMERMRAIAKEKNEIKLVKQHKTKRPKERSSTTSVDKDRDILTNKEDDVNKERDLESQSRQVDNVKKLKKSERIKSSQVKTEEIQGGYQHVTSSNKSILIADSAADDTTQYDQVKQYDSKSQTKRALSRASNKSADFKQDISTTSIRSDLKQDISKASEQSSHLKQDISKASVQSSHLKQDISKASEQSSHLKQDISKASVQSSHLKQDISKTSEQSSHLKQDISKTSEQSSHLKQDISKTSEQSSHLKIAISKASEQFSNLKQDISKASIQSSNIKQEISEASAHYSNIKQDILKASVQSSNIKQDISKASIQSSNIKQDILKASDQSSNIKQDISKASVQSSNMKQDISKAGVQSSNMKQDISKAGVLSSNIKQDFSTPTSTASDFKKDVSKIGVLSSSVLDKITSNDSDKSTTLKHDFSKSGHQSSKRKHDSDMLGSLSSSLEADTEEVEVIAPHSIKVIKRKGSMESVISKTYSVTDDDNNYPDDKQDYNDEDDTESSVYSKQEPLTEDTAPTDDEFPVDVLYDNALLAHSTSSRTVHQRTLRRARGRRDGISVPKPSHNVSVKRAKARLHDRKHIHLPAESVIEDMKTGDLTQALIIPSSINKETKRDKIAEQFHLGGGKSGSKDLAKNYIETKGIYELFHFLTTRLITDRPVRALDYLIDTVRGIDASRVAVRDAYTSS